MAREKTKRRFIKETRKNACPACLDRDEKYDFQPLVDEDYKPRKATFGNQFIEDEPCELCGGRREVTEVNVVGFEWRRYPWTIVK